MVEFLFLDLDDTILDFRMAERVALTKTLTAFGIEPTPTVISRFSFHSEAHWRRLEKGELTRAQVRIGRFAALMAELGEERDIESISRVYTENLAVGHYFLPGAEEAVKSLSGKYRLFLASNGSAKVQAGRLTSADLYRFFEQVFVSEEIGHNKPSKAYFDACFSRIPDFDPEKAIIVGDSLTSDIRGGNNAGIRTCWVNPKHAPRDPEIHVDHEIECLSRLEALLETI